MPVAGQGYLHRCDSDMLVPVADADADADAKLTRSFAL